MTDYATEIADVTPAVRLNRSTVPTAALVSGRRDRPAGIVHLGLGNFHRAHQAVYTAAALAVEDGPWGIVGIANRSRSVVEAMAAQDLLYSVVEVAPGTSRVTVPGVHTRVLVATMIPALSSIKSPQPQRASLR
jgi:fructuronate reductase